MQEPDLYPGIFPLAQRTRFFELIIEGLPLADAAAECGVSPLTVAKTARADPDFYRDLLDALELSTAPYERLLADIAANAKNSPMARVQALKTLLEGKSSRYRHLTAPANPQAQIATNFANYPELDS